MLDCPAEVDSRSTPKVVEVEGSRGTLSDFSDHNRAE